MSGRQAGRQEHTKETETEDNRQQTRTSVDVHDRMVERMTSKLTIIIMQLRIVDMVVLVYETIDLNMIRRFVVSYIRLIVI